MKKILFIVNSNKNADKPIKVTNFVIPSYLAVKKIGYEFHLNTHYHNPDEISIQYDDICFHTIEIYRNPFSIDIIKAYKQMITILKEEKFDAIHCNTPVGGILGRLCGKKAKVPKVIYTAHGFHFYKGAPIFNRTILKWAEMWMAHFTDAIITINKEDYQAAQGFKLRNSGKVYYIPGVGVDTKLYRLDGFDREGLRNSLQLKEEDVVLIAVGDMIRRKNYITSIKAVAKANNPKLKFLVCGKGPELKSLQALAKELGVEDQVHFLGFRRDINELLKAADVFLFTTYQEGLPRSMMEAMASGLPCIASEIRGNVDLIVDGNGGYLRKPEDVDGFTEAIHLLSSDEKLRKKMGNNNLNTMKRFDVEIVKNEMLKVYDIELL